MFYGSIIQKQLSLMCYIPSYIPSSTLLIPQLIVMFKLIPYLTVLSLNIALTYTWYIYFTTITTKKYEL